MTDGNIVAARKKLGLAVQRLTGPQMGVYHDRTLYGHSLYNVLIADLAGTQGDTRTPAKSLPPLWIDAMQLRATIDHKTHQWCPKPGNTPTRLQKLAFQSWRPQDTKQVDDMAHTVDGWCESILSLVYPTSRKFISAPCPSCGKAIVYRRDSGGDVVRQEALRWAPNVGFECQACKAHWAPDQTLFFARLLGFDLPEGVLE